VSPLARPRAARRRTGVRIAADIARDAHGLESVAAFFDKSA
jgi:hypothetical protein